MVPDAVHHLPALPLQNQRTFQKVVAVGGKRTGQLIHAQQEGEFPLDLRIIGQLLVRRIKRQGKSLPSMVVHSTCTIAYCRLLPLKRMADVIKKRVLRAGMEFAMIRM
ncbi:hypothetical protein D3C75_963940 [compost metagenome]